uniref:Uncharacterized protein n=1 Tax=Phytophthora ramorum TaxID=164328 RepID=H3H7L3_PHYRM
MPGETFADFAAGLRDLTGQNRTPKPQTLEQAVDKATEIDDPIDNVAQGMQNIGQAWATAPNPYLISMNGTTGQTMMLPGVGSSLSDMVESSALAGGVEIEDMAHFTNPQGVWNKYSGTWDVPGDRVWNGRCWRPNKRERQLKETREHQRSGKRIPRHDKKMKVMVVRSADESSEASDEEEAPPAPQSKKRKFSVRQAKTKEPARNSDALMRAANRPNPIGYLVREDAQDDNVMESGGDAWFRAEMKMRDDGRARRYVATVRPAMAAMRYVRTGTITKEDGTAMKYGNSMKNHGGVLTTEEGGESTSNDVVVAGEGASETLASAMLDEIVLPLETELNDAELAKYGSMAKVRAVLKHSKKVAKQQRARHARRRHEEADTGGIESTVTAIDDARQARRRLQAEEARQELRRRRTHRMHDASGQSERSARRARVSLAQKPRKSGVTAATNEQVIDAEASDGLPTATMKVDGESHRIKLDSGARYSVAGTDWMAR